LAEIGTIFGGRYKLIELLGQGGMATIFRALDTQLGREVAVKLLRPEYLRDPDFSSRFRQEAQNAASLSHPNVVTVYDYGEDPSGPFIVMEYVDGEDLATILRRNGALPPTQAARIAAAVARALAASHSRGIVHRDVKPGNVLIARDGRVKVVDFGIARAMAEAQMTLPGTTLGSVHYFSPEQARGEPATNESDIFALGIVLFEMLTGSRPWEGDSAAGVALARLTGPVPDPALVRGSIPPDLAAITRKALARVPSDRFASAAAMAEALESSRTSAAGAAGAGAAGAAGATIAAGGIARSNPTVTAYPADAYARPGDDPRTRGAPDRVRPRPAPIEPDDDEPTGTSPIVWLAGLVAIAILAAVAFLVFQMLSGPTTPEQPSEVVVPELVGTLLADATRQVEALDLILEPTLAPSDQPAGTITEQEPPEGSTVAPGSTIRVTVAEGLQTAPTPNLRNKTEAQAVQEIVAAGLIPGTKTEAFDPTVPEGLIATQNPAPGVLVAKGSPVDYTVSQGPEPTPSPSPTPSPTPVPTPTPTPVPTPTPTPVPTPTPPPTAIPTESLIPAP
jgi:tRNA A-37 threonylcarbamoyl transferase component Bud32